MIALSAYSRGLIGMIAFLGFLLAASMTLAWERGERIVSIGGAVTEIVYELGQQDRLVARDTTSSFPAEAEALPDVGYMRALSTEGVLSVAPDVIVAVEGAGPPETIALLKEADIDFHVVPEAYTREAIGDKIRAVGAALDVPEAAAELAARVDAEIAAAEATARAASVNKRVLFILSTQGGRILASGSGTAASSIIEMAGGINAVTAFEGYKPLTDEAVSLAAPDVILLMDRDGDHAAADAALLAMPAVATTPAAATRSIVRMDGLYLLGFGPRTAAAIADLSSALIGKPGP